MAGLFERPWIQSNGPINTWHVKGSVLSKKTGQKVSGIKVEIGIVVKTLSTGKLTEYTRQATTDANGSFDRLFTADLWLYDQVITQVTVVVKPPKKTFHAGDWGQTFPGDGKSFSTINTNTDTVWDDREST